MSFKHGEDCHSASCLYITVRTRLQCHVFASLWGHAFSVMSLHHAEDKHSVSCLYMIVRHTFSVMSLHHCEDKHSVSCLCITVRTSTLCHVLHHCEDNPIVWCLWNTVGTSLQCHVIETLWAQTFGAVSFKHCKDKPRVQRLSDTARTIWNKKRPRAPVQNQQTRELISARKTSHMNTTTKTWITCGINSHLACQ